MNVIHIAFKSQHSIFDEQAKHSRTKNTTFKTRVCTDCDGSRGH